MSWEIHVISMNDEILAIAPCHQQGDSSCFAIDSSYYVAGGRIKKLELRENGQLRAVIGEQSYQRMVVTAVKYVAIPHRHLIVTADEWIKDPSKDAVCTCGSWKVYGKDSGCCSDLCDSRG